MVFNIENEFLKAEIDSFGGELRKLIDLESGENYIWCADKTVWGKTSPNLFPAIGMIKNKGYVYDGQFHTMTKHGFIRDMEFEIALHTESELKLNLKSNNNTLEMYPYEFELFIIYALKERTLSVTFEIRNLSGREMPFALGGHTAFSTELSGTKMTDYSLIFDEKEVRLSCLRVSTDTCLLEGGEEFLCEGRSIALKPELFDTDAMIFKNIKSKTAELYSEKLANSVVVEYSDFAHLGVWAMLGTDRFVCIEPWTTLPDSLVFDGVFKNKMDVELLEEYRSKQYTYNITLKKNIKSE